MNFQNLKVAVLGLGLSGRAACSFLLKRGARVTGIDGNAAHLASSAALADLKKQGCVFLHEGEVLSLKEIDLLVVSPGVPPTNRICQMASASQIPVIGEVELAFGEIEIPCIGVTGTNGKTTVTLLIEHVLKSCGFKALALGNIGTPLTEAVDTLEECNFAVVELSSFQLDTMHERCLDSAVLLNITPDHLDRYKTMDAYAHSKAQIGKFVKEGGVFYLEESAYRNYTNLFSNVKPLRYGYGQECDLVAKEGGVYLKGKLAFEFRDLVSQTRSHDIENIMAAFGICSHYGVTGEQFLRSLKTFTKPKHRIELFKTFKGIAFYDDSKGTNIDAVIRAVETVPGKIVLIAGGVDKGAPYTPWIEAFMGKVKAICAIGQASRQIENDLKEHLPVTRHASLEEAVEAALKSAVGGDAILLSPGCSSYDMFRDYAHRGEEFQRIVHSKLKE